MASISLPRFLQKLQKITEEADPKIAGWNKDGTQFIVHGPKFENTILRKYFKGRKATFIRQLHFYGFKKLDNKGQSWAFSHPKFLRDAPHLIYEIRRKTRSDDSGPASKEEVSALRNQLEIMRQHMKSMESVILSLQSEIRSQAGGASFPDVPSENGKAKRLSESTIEIPAKKRFTSALPFADGLANSMYNQQSEEESLSPQGSTTGSLDDMKKGKKGHMGGDADLLLEDLLGFDDEFADLFLGLPPDEVSPQVESKTECTIFLKSASRDVPMSNEVFAGFLSRFVEHSILLQKKGLLEQEPDPELEIFVHSTLPNDNPLKDLLSHSTPSVRAVLINVLSDVTGTPWFLKQDGSIDRSDDAEAQPFPMRPIISFVTDQAMTEITGEGFIQFLSFLLQSAINDDPREPAPKPRFRNSTFFQTFQKYFSEQVNRVMIRAKNSLEEFKRTNGRTCL